MVNSWFSCVIDPIFPEILIMQTLRLIGKKIIIILIKNFSSCEGPFFKSSAQTTAFDCKGLIRSV